MNNLIDLHTHSVLSTHAYSSLSENIAYANKANLKYYGISEHQYDTKGVGGHHFSVHNLRIVPSIINGTRFLKGLELNILLNGELDTSKIKKEYLDYGIASIHSYIYEDQGVDKNTEAYLNVLDSEFITILGHIDDGHYPSDYEKIVKKCKDVHKLIEINNSSLRPTCSRLNSRDNMIKLIQVCKKYNQHLIINSDAHICYDVGTYELGLNLLKEFDYPLDLVLNFNEELIKKYFG